MLTTLMKSVLFGVDAHDKAIFGIVPAVLGARTSGQLSPGAPGGPHRSIQALRYE